VNQSEIGRYSRNKGARYERKVAEIFRDALGWDLVRNLEQSRRDIHGDLVDRQTLYAPHNFIIECKNRKFSWDSALTWNEKADAPPKWLIEAHKKDPEANCLLVFKSQALINYGMALFQSDEFDIKFDGFISGDLCFDTLDNMLNYIKKCLLNKHQKT